jgi:hypothetical protein
VPQCGERLYGMEAHRGIGIVLYQLNQTRTCRTVLLPGQPDDGGAPNRFGIVIEHLR